MSGPALDSRDCDVVVALADGDAVVARPDLGVGDGDRRVALEVDAVGVGALRGRDDLDAARLEVRVAQQRNVEELAVHRCYVLHFAVVCR